MGTFTTKVGLTSVYNGDNVTQQSGRLWRPWTGTEETTGAHKVSLDDLILLLMFFFLNSNVRCLMDTKFNKVVLF